MEYKVLLDKKSNFREAGTEEQSQFILSIIEALDIPFEWDSSTTFTIMDKLRLKKLCNQYNISIIDDTDGNAKIYLEGQVIAEWHKPSFILREDLGQIDPKKRLYIEMKCSFSSMFEENNN